MYFVWFPLLKAAIAFALLAWSGWLMFNYLQDKSNTKKLWWRLIPLAVAVIMTLYAPVRLGNQTESEQRIQRTYDSRPQTEEIIIDRHSVDEYNPSDNQDEVKRITNQ